MMTTTQRRLWQSEHSELYEVPSQFDVFVDEDILQDISKREDVCPRFARNIGSGYMVTIAVDMPWPEDRAAPYCSRYAVTLEWKSDAITLYLGDDMHFALQVACNILPNKAHETMLLSWPTGK